MTDPIAEAVERAVDYGAPPKVWSVGPEADVVFGDGPNPFDGMTVSHWSVD